MSTSKPVYFILGILLFTCSVSGQQRFLKVEPNHSTVGFSIPIAGFSIVTGKFTEYEIELDWNDDDFTQSVVKATIQASSINTGIPDRDDHLRSTDFFDVEKYPLITFMSDSISKTNYSEYIAHGKFTMHGVSKSIDLPFQIVKMDGNTIGFSSRTHVKRKDYGVGSEFQHTSMPDFLANKVEVAIDFWTKKRKVE